MNTSDKGMAKGRLRGLLCPSCNIRERRGGLLFDAYRRPPAVILDIEVPYWTPEDGYARRQPSVCWLPGFDERGTLPPTVEVPRPVQSPRSPRRRNEAVAGFCGPYNAAGMV